MKYSRKQINKAGDILISSKDTNEYNLALRKIKNWRALHLVALDALQKELSPIIEKISSKILFLSRRLKRITSIIYKLDINPDMGLGGMQDIGGIRIVVNDVDSLRKMKEILCTNILPSFTLDPSKIRDYVFESPKDSGYRSIHFVYVYNSENSDYNGAKIELQIRTKLQHIWAMAVETAGLITNSALKSSIGDDDWLEFFKIVSSLYAIKEGLPIIKSHRDEGMTTYALMQLLYKKDKKFKFNDKLKVLKVSYSYAEKKDFQDGYYILSIDFKIRRVNITPCPNDKDIAASRLYSMAERNVSDNTKAVVLVSVPKMQELQEAYPSYFLDTTKFIETVDTILLNFKRINRDCKLNCVK